MFVFICTCLLTQQQKHMLQLCLFTLILFQGVLIIIKPLPDSQPYLSKCSDPGPEAATCSLPYKEMQSALYGNSAQPQCSHYMQSAFYSNTVQPQTTCSLPFIVINTATDYMQSAIYSNCTQSQTTCSLPYIVIIHSHI